MSCQACVCDKCALSVSEREANRNDVERKLLELEKVADIQNDTIAELVERFMKLEARFWGKK